MKKIKLPLEMVNGVQVRTLDELKENWNLEKVLNYYLNGKLQTWLTDRYYTELAEEVAALGGITDNAELQQKLCGIFGIEIKEDFVDVEAVAERNRRLEILRQYTADDAVLKNVDKVAFNQEELADLLDEDENVIYLCDNKFSIPLSLKGKKYIGLGDVEIQINSKEYVDFAKLEIELINVHFNKEYDELVNSHVTLYKKGEELEESKKYSEAFKYYYKAAEMGNDKALFKVGYFYRFALGVEEDFTKAMSYFQKSAQKGNARAMHNIGSLYYYGDGVAQNYNEAKTWYLRAAELNFNLSFAYLGDMYRDGNGVTRNYLEAVKWYRKAAEVNDAYAIAQIAELYNRNFIGNPDTNDDTALIWYEKLINLREFDRLYKICTQINTEPSHRNKRILMKKAADMGHANSAYETAELYSRRLGYMNGWLEPDKSIVLQYYRKAGELGHPEGFRKYNIYRDAWGM